MIIISVNEFNKTTRTQKRTSQMQISNKLDIMEHVRHSVLRAPYYKKTRSAKGKKNINNVNTAKSAINKTLSERQEE